MNVRATRGPHSASSPGLDFEVEITGVRTVDERNAEGFANAIDVDALPDVVDLTDDSSFPLPPVLSKKENAPPPNQLPQLEAPVAKDAAEEVRTLRRQWWSQWRSTLQRAVVLMTMWARRCRTKK